MSVLFGLIWAILTSVSMIVTIKYYLPVLHIRLQKTPSETQAIDAVEEVTFQRVHSVGPIMLLAFAIIFSAVCGYVTYNNMASYIAMFKLTAAFSVLACISITDLKFKVIPNLYSLILLGSRGITIILECIFVRESMIKWLLNSLFAMLAAGILLIVVSIITKGGIGMGDVKLFSSLGFLCGMRSVCVTLIMAFFLCSIVSLFLLLTKKKKIKDSLPLGPFIWLGYGIAVLLSAV